MALKVDIIFKDRNGRMVTRERDFNDEKHLQNYISKCINGVDPTKPKYITHRIIHANEEKILNLNDAQRIFDYAKEGKYSTLKELLLQEFKIRI